MKVAIYGLEPRKTMPPTFQLLLFKKEEVLAPYVSQTVDLIVVREGIADDIINTSDNHGLEVVVVADDVSPHTVRRWISRGAASVWPYEAWEEHLIMRQAGESVEDTGRIFERPSFDLSISKSKSTTTVIAVGGVYSGVGSTHTALMVGEYLTKSGKVAIWEGGNRPCFDFLSFLEEGAYKQELSFAYGGVTLFGQETDWRWIEQSGSYRYLILDLGDLTDNAEVQRHFHKADLPILIGSGSHWRSRELIQFCQANAHTYQNRWRIAMPLASEEVRLEFAEILIGRPIFAIPLNPDVQQIESSTATVLEGILSPVITKRPKRGLARLFS